MTNFVVFGGSGDLAKNYLYPSLFNLWYRGTVFNYFGFGRSPLSDTDFQTLVLDSTTNQEFSSLFHYFSGNYDTLGLKELAVHLSSQTIFYFALPTRLEVIKPLIQAIIDHHLFDPHSTRLVIEKPFGTDYRSAKELMDFLENSVGSNSVFLVDHYLTKELVRNIVALRFANPILGELWNKKYIGEINITVAESRGIDSRGEYYDHTGAIRDMIQNHCLQLLVLMTMDSPASLESGDFTHEKLNILKKVSLFDDSPKSVSLGQYEHYQKEAGIDPHSRTETFAQIKFKVNHSNWWEVPITITTGKKLEKKLTEIVVVFKNNFPTLWGNPKKLVPNQLTINLSPDNDILLTINSEFNPQKNLPRPMSLRLGSLDPALIAASSYENVIKDVVDGNRLNSPSFEEILLQWQIVDKILALPHLRDHLFCY